MKLLSMSIPSICSYEQAVCQQDCCQRIQLFLSCGDRDEKIHAYSLLTNRLLERQFFFVQFPFFLLKQQSPLSRRIPLNLILRAREGYAFI
jgi:hypothetical protein